MTQYIFLMERKFIYFEIYYYDYIFFIGQFEKKDIFIKSFIYTAIKNLFKRKIYSECLMCN